MAKEAAEGILKFLGRERKIVVAAVVALGFVEAGRIGLKFLDGSFQVDYGGGHGSAIRKQKSEFSNQKIENRPVIPIKGMGMPYKREEPLNIQNGR